MDPESATALLERTIIQFVEHQRRQEVIYQEMADRFEAALQARYAMASQPPQFQCLLGDTISFSFTDNPLSIHYSPPDAIPFSMCQSCNEFTHKIHECPTFLRMPPAERLSTIRVHSLCRKCLTATHLTKVCTSSPCKRCAGHHSSLLHDAFHVANAPSAESIRVASLLHHDALPLSQVPEIVDVDRLTHHHVSMSPLATECKPKEIPGELSVHTASQDVEIPHLCAKDANLSDLVRTSPPHDDFPTSHEVTTPAHVGDSSQCTPANHLSAMKIVSDASNPPRCEEVEQSTITEALCKHRRDIGSTNSPDNASSTSCRDPSIAAEASSDAMIDPESFSSPHVADSDSLVEPTTAFRGPTVFSGSLPGSPDALAVSECPAEPTATDDSPCTASASTMDPPTVAGLPSSPVPIPGSREPLTAREFPAEPTATDLAPTSTTADSTMDAPSVEGLTCPPTVSVLLPGSPNPLAASNFPAKSLATVVAPNTAIGTTHSLPRIETDHVSVRRLSGNPTAHPGTLAHDPHRHKFPRKGPDVFPHLFTLSYHAEVLPRGVKVNITSQSYATSESSEFNSALFPVSTACQSTRGPQCSLQDNLPSDFVQEEDHLASPTMRQPAASLLLLLFVLILSSVRNLPRPEAVVVAPSWRAPHVLTGKSSSSRAGDKGTSSSILHGPRNEGANVSCLTRRATTAPPIDQLPSISPELPELVLQHPMGSLLSCPTDHTNAWPSARSGAHDEHQTLLCFVSPAAHLATNSVSSTGRLNSTQRRVEFILDSIDEPQDLLLTSNLCHHGILSLQMTKDYNACRCGKHPEPPNSLPHVAISPPAKPAHQPGKTPDRFSLRGCCRSRVTSTHATNGHTISFNGKRYGLNSGLPYEAPCPPSKPTHQLGKIPDGISIQEFCRGRVTSTHAAKAFTVSSCITRSGHHSSRGHRAPPPTETKSSGNSGNATTMKPYQNPRMTPAENPPPHDVTNDTLTIRASNLLASISGVMQIVGATTLCLLQVVHDVLLAQTHPPSAISLASTHSSPENLQNIPWRYPCEAIHYHCQTPAVGCAFPSTSAVYSITWPSARSSARNGRELFPWLVSSAAHLTTGNPHHVLSFYSHSVGSPPVGQKSDAFSANHPPQLIWTPEDTLKDSEGLPPSTAPPAACSRQKWRERQIHSSWQQRRWWPIPANVFGIVPAIPAPPRAAIFSLSPTAQRQFCAERIGRDALVEPGVAPQVKSPQKSMPIRPNPES